MQIIISGKLACLKKNTSFDFIFENRLFTGSDSYTLTITFPLKDCAQNIDIFGHIHRADVEKSNVVFDCDIRDGEFFMSGCITVTEISDTEVKTQFLEGKSAQNFDSTFDDIYLNELFLGYPEDRSPSHYDPEDAFRPYPYNNWVPLPWANNSYGELHNVVSVDEESGKYKEFTQERSSLTFQPYLLYILEKICEVTGYTGDFSQITVSRMADLVICNTLPPAWEAWNFAIALPHWSLTEFFEQLEYFLFGEFDINHKNRTISFSFTRKALEKVESVRLDKVVDSYTAEVTREDDSKYFGSSNLKYADNDSLLWAYSSCDWFIRANKKKAVVFNTMEDLIAEAKGLQVSGVQTMSGPGHSGEGFTRGYMRGSRGNKLFFCKENNTYFVMYCYKSVFYKKVGESKMYKYYNRLLPVNQFGERFVSEDSDDIEMKIVPAWIEGTDDTYGNMLFLNCGDRGDNTGWVMSEDGTVSSGDSTTWSGVTENTRGHDGIDYDAGDLAQGTASYAIGKGEKDKSEDYFSCIYMGIWDGRYYHLPYQPHPVVDFIEVRDDFSVVIAEEYSLRINDGSMDSSGGVIRNIDGKKKYHFSFLSDTVPSPRAVFYINGGKYLCEKITATFHESGRSRLLKGIFYRILE